MGDNLENKDRLRKEALEHELPSFSARIHCGGVHRTDDEFHAVGTGASQLGETVNYSNKMWTIRRVAPYATSAVFVIAAAQLIIFAPESRTVAATIVAGALVILAAGISGFTSLSARLPGIRIDTRAPNNPNSDTTKRP